jgi:hypothetical protein
MGASTSHNPMGLYRDSFTFMRRSERSREWEIEGVIE